MQNEQDLTRFVVVDGRLLGADWVPSPNFNVRPVGAVVDTIVIHNISLPPSRFGQVDGRGVHFVKAFFCNELDWSADPYFEQIRGLEVSAHLLIERDGRVTQFVNFGDRAWHAGVSRFLGRDRCNDFSVGIELEGADDVPFTAVQYEVLAAVVVALYRAYPKTRRHLVGHSDIAPDRKTDPGGCFDWVRLRSCVARLLRVD